MRIQNCILLAAGAGQRLGGALPKAMVRIAGRSLIEHLLLATQEAGFEETIVVVGHQHDQLRHHLQDSPAAAEHRLSWVLQEDWRGTGHAVFCALPALTPGTQTVLIACADHPLHRPETVNAFLAEHRRSGWDLTIMTYQSAVPNDCGRIIRNDAGEVLQIKERHDGSYADSGGSEISAGMYAVEAPFLERGLALLMQENLAGEYYLTRIIEYAHREGRKVGTFELADTTEALGVNTPEELALAGEVFSRRNTVESAPA